MNAKTAKMLRKAARMATAAHPDGAIMKHAVTGKLKTVPSFKMLYKHLKKSTAKGAK